MPTLAGGAGHREVLAVNVLLNCVLVHHLLAEVAHQLSVLQEVPHLRDLGKGALAPDHVVLEPSKSELLQILE